MRKNISRSLNRFILRHRMLLFLCSILILLVFFPVIHQHFTNYMAVMELFFITLLISGIYIVSENKQILMVAILLAILAFTIIWFNLFINSHALLIFGLSLEIVFFTITTTTIITHVLTYKKVSADKIYGAICGYLLIGIIWALVYTTLELAFPGSFNFINGYTFHNEALTQHRFYFANFIYYSFVTLTTLGYGDIAPLSNEARVFSSLEAVIGQLYVAILIARLVGLHISHSHLLDRNK